jgi:hypothetical protein
MWEAVMGWTCSKDVNTRDSNIIFVGKTLGEHQQGKRE